MYDKEHGSPHFHALYSGRKGSFAIDTLDMLAGDLAARQVRLVQQCASDHEEKLTANWLRTRDGKPLQAIAPL